MDDYWSNDRNCYVAPSPAASKDDPLYEGRSNGDIYYCRDPFTGGNGYSFWAATPPAGAAPNPRDLALQAIEQMQLKATPIGIVPKDQPGKVGLVGMPVWMWSDSQAVNVTGPITRTATAGAFSVTATAALKRTAWDMGDGRTVICNGSNALGTPYKAAYGKKDSPTCGHHYSAQGGYTVEVTSYWVVEWNGLGQSGQIPVELSDSTDITVGEVQVLTGRSS